MLICGRKQFEEPDSNLGSSSFSNKKSSKISSFTNSSINYKNLFISSFLNSFNLYKNSNYKSIISKTFNLKSWTSINSSPSSNKVSFSYNEFAICNLIDNLLIIDLSTLEPTVIKFNSTILSFIIINSRNYMHQYLIIETDSSFYYTLLLKDEYSNIKDQNKDEIEPIQMKFRSDALLSLTLQTYYNCEPILVLLNQNFTVDIFHVSDLENTLLSVDISFIEDQILKICIYEKVILVFIKRKYEFFIKVISCLPNIGINMNKNYLKEEKDKIQVFSSKINDNNSSKDNKIWCDKDLRFLKSREICEISLPCFNILGVRFVNRFEDIISKDLNNLYCFDSIIFNKNNIKKNIYEEDISRKEIKDEALCYFYGSDSIFKINFENKFLKCDFFLNFLQNIDLNFQVLIKF